MSDRDSTTSRRSRVASPKISLDQPIQLPERKRPLRQPKLEVKQPASTPKTEVVNLASPPRRSTERTHSSQSSKVANVETPKSVRKQESPPKKQESPPRSARIPIPTKEKTPPKSVRKQESPPRSVRVPIPTKEKTPPKSVRVPIPSIRSKVPTRQESPQRSARVPTRQESPPRSVRRPPTIQIASIQDDETSEETQSPMSYEQEEKSFHDENLWHWISKPEMIWSDDLPDFDSLGKDQKIFLREKYYNELHRRVTESHISANSMARIDWRSDPLEKLHTRYCQTIRNLQISRKKKTSKSWIFGWFLILEMFVKHMMEIDVSGYTKIQMSNARYDEYLYDLAERNTGPGEEDWHPLFSIGVVSLVQLIVMAVIHRWVGKDAQLLEFVGGKEKIMNVVADLATTGRIEELVDDEGNFSQSKIVKAVLNGVSNGDNPPFEK